MFWGGVVKEKVYNWSVVKFLKFWRRINMQFLPSDLFG